MRMCMEGMVSESVTAESILVCMEGMMSECVAAEMHSCVHGSQEVSVCDSRDEFSCAWKS